MMTFSIFWRKTYAYFNFFLNCRDGKYMAHMLSLPTPKFIADNASQSWYSLSLNLEVIP